MKSIPKKSDMAVAFRLVATEPEDNDIIRSLQLTARYILDALADIFREKNSSFFINTYVASWLRIGVLLAEKRNIFSVAVTDPIIAIELYEIVSAETNEADFDLLEPIAPEMQTLISMYEEFGNSSILHEQLAVTCYRACEAAFLAIRKPQIMQTTITVED